jgi:uncharacterized protein YkwD
MKIAIKTLIASAVVAGTLVLNGCGGGGDKADPDNGGYTDMFPNPVPFDAPPISEAQKAEFLNAVNAVRAQGIDCGVDYGYMPPVQPLHWSDALYRAAYEHTVDMASTHTLGHIGSGTDSDWTAQVQNLGRGSTKSERAANNGIREAYVVFENAVSGAGSYGSAMNAWIHSPGHCRTIMMPGVNAFGASPGISGYWTQDFGND